MTYDSDHPETIRAKAQARKTILEARAKLHPAAQTVYAIYDGLSGIVGQIGCFILMGLIFAACLAAYAPGVYSKLFGR